MNASLGLTVRAQVLQHIVDRVLEAGTGFVGSTYALRYELANFKAVHSLRENAVDSFGTHSSSGKRVDCRVEVRSSSEAVQRFSKSIKTKQGC